MKNQDQNTLSELRTTQSITKHKSKTADHMVLPTPDSKNFGFVKLVKLFFGAMTFIALCFSLIFLVLTAAVIVDGDTSAKAFVALSISQAAVASSSAILYLLARKSKKERFAQERNPISLQFAKQKILFQLSVFGLIIFTVFVIFLTTTIKENRFAHYIIFFNSCFFFFAYWLLGRMFWYCPGCGARLSFTNKYTDRQYIQSCPHCHARLQ